MKPKYATSKFRNQTVGASLVTAITICFGSTALAVENFWTGTTSNQWNTATNWSLGRVPANPNGAPSGDTFDDAVISTLTNFPVNSVNNSPLPRDIAIGQGGGNTGRLDHTSGTTATGAGSWMRVGNNGGVGTYNLANTTLLAGGISGFAQGNGNLNVGGRLFVGVGGSSNGVANINTSGTIAIGTQLQIGNGGGTGVMNLENGIVTTGGEWVEVGNGGGSNGTLNMTGGSITKVGNDHFIIASNGATGVANVSAGTININNQIWVGQAGGSNGTLNLSGSGTIINNSWVAIGRDTGTGTVNMLAGNPTWTKNGGGTSFIVGASGPGTLTQSVGLVNVAAGDTWIGEGNTGNYTLSGSGEFRAGFFQLARNGGSTGNVNLDGGTLRVAQISGGGGVENLHFNGTQVIATGVQPNFITAIDAGKAFVDGGGMKIDSNGFAIGSTHAFNGVGGVTKSGLGTLTLSGASTYGGSNSVNQGKLVVTTANNAPTAVYAVKDGAKLGIRQTSNTASLAVTNATFGVSGASTLDIDLGSIAGIPTAAPLSVTGTLTLNGTVTLNIDDALPAIGTIPLVSYVGPKAGSGSFLIGKLPNSITGLLTDNGTGSVFLTVTSALRWKGTTDGVNPNSTWDISNTPNWTDGLSNLATTYANPSAVLFSDDPSVLTSNVTLGGTVAPSRVSFINSSLGYFLTGAGKITGSAYLLKQGTAPLSLLTVNNDYTGTTTLEGGVTTVNSLADGGSPSSIGASSPDASNLVLSGGTLNYTGPSTSINRGFTIGEANSGISVTNDLTLSGPVVSTAGNLIKTGTGNLTLSNTGANTFGTISPGLRVNQGTLTLSGSGTQTNTVAGELWVASNPDVPANMVLNNASLTTGSWIAVGRGNGTTGTVSNFIATNSSIISTNFSAGFNNGIAGNLASQNVTLTDTTWNNGGVTNLGESGGSTAVMELGGSSVYTGVGNVILGVGAGANGSMTIKGNASFVKTGSELRIGGAGTGTMNLQNDGIFNASGGGFCNLGFAAGSNGFLNVGGNSSFSANSEIRIGATGTGTVIQTGGTISGASWIQLGRLGAASAGTLSVSGGNFNQTNGATRLMVGEEGQGTLNVSGLGTVTSAGGVNLANVAAAVGTVNLNAGGTLVAKDLVAGAGGAGSATVNFDGGILRATAAGVNSPFMAFHDIVRILAGGATIDSNGNDVSINQAFSDDSTGGTLTKLGTGALYMNGFNSYLGTTLVSEGTLGGNGFIAGLVSVATGASLNPGSVTPGMLTVDAAVFATNSTLTVDMSAIGDTLAVVNNLNITNAKLVLNGIPTAAVYVIASYGSLTPSVSPSFAAPLPVLPPGYTIDYNYNGNNQIAITRPPTAFENWIDTYYPGETDPAIVGLTADPDGDGMTNLAEFAMNGNPTTGTSSGKMVGKIANVGGVPALVLTLPVRTVATFSGATEQVASVSGITYKIQGSDQLGTWDLAVSEVFGADKTAIEAGLPALDGGWSYRTFRSPGPVTGDPMDFLRAVFVSQ